MRRHALRVLGSVAVAAAALTFATSSYAANPGGTSCAADGKINGRGATFQTNASRLR